MITVDYAKEKHEQGSVNMTAVYYVKEKHEQDPCPEYNGNHTRQRLVSLSLSDIPRVFNNTDVDYLLTSQGPC